MRRLIVGGCAAALAAAALAPTPASARGAQPAPNSRAFTKAVTVNGVLAHLRVLQRIADRNDGTRASGLPGYEESVDYVAKRLKKAGYKVTVQDFTFPFFQELAPPTLSTTRAGGQDFETATFTYSGSGSVTGTLVPADGITIPPGEPGSTPSGCSPDDFEPAPADEDAVALIQRGTCNFSVKAANAQAAGYDAVVIFNEGQEGRDGLVQGTLGEAFDLPVVGVSYADGVTLYQAAQAGPVSVTVTTSTENDPERVTHNVIAETKGGDPEQVVVVGSHLDSVTEGPGINDNGSGSALNLELAEELAKQKVKLRQKVRFAFWGAEELGLLGSAHYVATLSDDDLASLYANLNFDMIASPNYVRFVYDGDGSAEEDAEAGPPGSAQIEKVFTDYYAKRGLPVEPTAFDGRSDYGPFIEVGVPAGGLFSGAEGEKTAEEAVIYGGTAGEWYDPCYHQACDTMNNLDEDAISELGDGAAHALWTLATSKQGLFGDERSSNGTLSSTTSGLAPLGRAHRPTAAELADPSIAGALR